jgi:hypothetical protein
MKALSQNEIKLLYSILPEDKPGYIKYRELISAMKYCGEGRFGNGNFYIGTGIAKPDLTIPSTPVFAVGIAKTNLGDFDILIHEYEDDLIELQLSNRTDDDRELIIEEVTDHSSWIPGNNSPGKDDIVKELALIKDEYTLVIDKPNKKIWLHDHKSGVNHIIPVSNYFNELMRLKKIKDESLFKSPISFFNRLDNYTDEEFKLAFYQYNKFMRRFDITINPEDLIKPRRKKKSFLKIFSRG